MARYTLARKDQLDSMAATIAALQAQINAISQSQPSAIAGYLGGRMIEEFPGSSKDAKLTQGASYSAQQTYKPALLLMNNEQYEFTTPIDVYQGFALLGGPKFGDFKRSANSTPQDIRINTNGPWLRLPRGGDRFDIHIARLSFFGVTSATVFLANAPGSGSKGVLWTSVIEDVGFSLFQSVLGTEAESLGMTANTFKGYWNINNARGIQIHIGGSDNNLWTDGMLLDTPTSQSSGGQVPYLMWLDYLEKTGIGPLYITCEGRPCGIRISGSPSQGALTFYGGMRVEGRNAGAPALGAVIRQDGGVTTFNDVWASFGLSNPSGSGRTGETGIISILGGYAEFNSCRYARANSVAETVPWIDASGSSTEIRVQNARPMQDGGAITGLPRVRYRNGALLSAWDNSITPVAA